MCTIIIGSSLYDIYLIVGPSGVRIPATIADDFAKKSNLFYAGTNIACEIRKMLINVLSNISSDGLKISWVD